MEVLNVDILGTRYAVHKGISEEEIPMLMKCDGITDWSSKDIYVCKYKEDSGLSDFERYEKSVIRHEIVHAFLYESGLNSCSGNCDCGWAINEEMVDWFAIMSPKIYKAFEQLGILD